MDDKEIKALWEASNSKLEKVLHISRQQSGEICRLKMQHLLSSMKPVKLFTLLIGVLWTAVAGSVLAGIYASAGASPYFLVLAGLQVLLTAAASVMYIFQLDILFYTDLSGPVSAVQRRLAKLATSSLWAARILFLQLPLWAGMFVPWGALAQGEWVYLALCLLLTFAFAVPAFWLFINIKYENRHEKWFRLIFRGQEWDPLLKAMALLEQLEEFQKEEGA